MLGVLFESRYDELLDVRDTQRILQKKKLDIFPIHHTVYIINKYTKTVDSVECMH